MCPGATVQPVTLTTGVIVMSVSSSSASGGIVSANVVPSAPVAVRLPPAVVIWAVTDRLRSGATVRLSGSGGAVNSSDATGGKDPAIAASLVCGVDPGSTDVLGDWRLGPLPQPATNKHTSAIRV